MLLGLEMDGYDPLLLHHRYSIHCIDIHTCTQIICTGSCTQSSVMQSKAALFHRGFVEYAFDVLSVGERRRKSV